MLEHHAGGVNTVVRGRGGTRFVVGEELDRIADAFTLVAASGVTPSLIIALIEDSCPSEVVMALTVIPLV